MLAAAATALATSAMTAMASAPIGENLGPLGLAEVGTEVDPVGGNDGSVKMEVTVNGENQIENTALGGSEVVEHVLLQVQIYIFVPVIRDRKVNDTRGNFTL